MVANTGTFSRLSASPSANEWVQDNTDSIHSGIAKALALMGQGTYLASGCTTTENAGTPAYLSIGDGGIFRNNEYIPITGSTASTDAATNANYSASHASINYYCLLVLADGTESGETANRLYLRGSASLVSSASSPVVAEPLGGDVILAMVEIVAGTATSAVSRKIQWLGINTLSNNLSIAYNNSGTYTETVNIIGGAAGTTISNVLGNLTIDNTVGDGDIIFKGTDDASDITALTLDMSEAGAAIFNNKVSSTQFNASGLTASEIVATDGSKNLQSLAVATYPSLTELSYVKGASSALQTQISAKAVLTGSTNNTITTVTGANAISGEANLTFNGSRLSIAQSSPLAILSTKGSVDKAISGTVSTTDASTTITGVSTAFLSQLRVGQTIKIGSEIRVILTITSDTVATTTAAFTSGGSGVVSGGTAYIDDVLLLMEDGNGTDVLGVRNNSIIALESGIINSVRVINGPPDGIASTLYATDRHIIVDLAGVPMPAQDYDFTLNGDNAIDDGRIFTIQCTVVGGGGPMGGTGVDIVLAGSDVLYDVDNAILANSSTRLQIVAGESYTILQQARNVFRVVHKTV